jgi:Tfp pilus assembly protein PilN
MAQINLLKQNNNNGLLASFSPKMLTIIFGVVFLCILGYYGFLFFQDRQINSQINDVSAEIESVHQKALAVKEKDELYTRQQQVKSLKELLPSHLYWSQFFEPLARATLKNAKYSAIKITPPNAVSLTVAVPSLEDMDKYLQVFDNADLNKYFSNVRIGGYNKIQGDTATSTQQIQFSVQMNFNPEIMNYKKAK